MIPLIGLMIGTYIITRMIETIINKETQGLVAICAFLTIGIVLFCLAGLFFNGLDKSLGMPNMPRIESSPGQ